MASNGFFVYVTSNRALLTIWEMVYSNTYFHFHKVNELTALFLLG